MSNSAASASGKQADIDGALSHHQVGADAVYPSQQQSMQATTLGVDPRIAAAIMATTAGNASGHYDYSAAMAHQQQQQQQMQHHHPHHGVYSMPPPQMVQQSVATRHGHSTRGSNGIVVPTAASTDDAPPIISNNTTTRKPSSRAASVKKRQAAKSAKKEKEGSPGPSFSSRPPRWTDYEVRYRIVFQELAS